MFFLNKLANFNRGSSNEKGFEFKKILNSFKLNKNRSYKYKLVSKEQARDLILNNSVLLIDVRSKEEYETIRLQNSINIPVNELSQNILNIEPNRARGIMIYCSTGSRSKSAIVLLNQLGYNNLYIWEYAAMNTFPYKELFISNRGNNNE